MAIVDAGQINQVVHNLVLNARQAMNDIGEIEIFAENATVSKSEHGKNLEPGTYIRVSIHDHGPGIPPAIISQIFDPYFSTKHEGRGLGLASCYSIVQNHSGLLTVDSRLGEGATFTFYLPSAPESSTVDRPSRVSLQEGSARVLVMDDDEVIQEIISEMLQVAGYTVVVAGDGRQAIDLYRQAMEKGKPFSVVIADLTIPGGMGGKEMAEDLLALDPGARLIVSSGYSSDPVMANFAEYGFKAVIVKPYKMEELVATLQQALRV
jgi:CheY-like chemotaxis protein